MPVNFYMYFIAGLLPIIIGYLYYHPSVAGAAWMKVNGFTPDYLKGANMTAILILSYILGVMLALVVGGLTIHQAQVHSLFIPDILESGSQAQTQFNDLMEQYGDRYRSFGHGALHGGIAAVFFTLPILGINALFERRGWKYITVHFFYWLITLMLMGGLLCRTLEFAPAS